MPPDQVDLILATTITNQLPLPIILGQPTGEIANVLRQFSLAPSTDRTLKRVASIYSTATDFDQRTSEVLRAVLIALEHVILVFEKEAGQKGLLKRLKQDRENKALRDQPKRRTAHAIIAGTKAANVLGE